MDIHGYPRDIDQDGIYMGYTWNIPCIYIKSGFQMTACSTETVGLKFTARPAALAALRLPSRWRQPDFNESSWPGGRGVCKPVTVTVEW